MDEERNTLKRVFNARNSVFCIGHNLYKVDGNFIYFRSRDEVDADLAEIGLELISFQGARGCYNGLAREIQI